VIPERFQPILRELAPLTELFRGGGFRLYLVGGTVRDLLAGELDEAVDFDATTDARPEDIKRLLTGWADAVWPQGEKFGTIAAKKRGPTGERSYEITTHRAEAYQPESRKPDVEFSDLIEADLSRRDFTINAMALELTSPSPTLVDPFGGAADLVTRTLRTPLGPEQSFSDDPLRMLRAARFIARLGAKPETGLADAVSAMRGRLSIVSAERIRDELDKIITLPHPGAGLWFAIDTGLAEEFLPELPAMRLEQDPIHHHKDVLTHTLAVVDNVRPPSEAASWPDGTPPQFDFRRTRLAALFHDVGKPRTRGYLKGKGVTFHHHDAVGAKMTRRRMDALRYSSADIQAVTELVALHLRFHTYSLGWTDSAVRRYVRDAGPLLSELNVLTRADCTTRNPKKAEMLAKRMDDLEARVAELAEREELAAIRPELDGTAVMEQLGLVPGPEVGRALAFLLEVRLEEGLLGKEIVRQRLDNWWQNHYAP